MNLNTFEDRINTVYNLNMELMEINGYKPE